MTKRILLFLIVLLSFSLIGCSTSPEFSEKIIDVNQFSRISSSELKTIMGVPEKIEGYSGISPKTKGKIKGKVYVYQNGKYDFILFDDKVVRMNIYSDKYKDKTKQPIAFRNEDDIFNLLGITPSKNIKKVTDNGYVLRYQLVSDKIADVWIVDVDKENKTFNNAKITYDLNYL